MAFEFRLADIGEGIDSAEVVEWHVAVGDEVREDQPLADMQTDKAIVAMPCPTDGVVLELRWQVGDMVPVGEVLAVFGDASELGDGAPASGDGASADGAPTDADAPAGPTADSAPAPPGPGDSASRSRSIPPETPAAPVAAGEASLTDLANAVAGRPLASPAVRALARERGIDLAAVRGSGPAGRILREDLERGPGAAGGAVAAPAAPAALMPAPREDEVVALRGTRRAIARNLTRSWSEIPHITDFREVDAGNLMDVRRRLRARLEAAGREEEARLLTPLALISKIAATVVRSHPRANASIDMEREEIVLHGSVNIALAIDGADGLVTPVIRDAERKSIPAIAAEISELARAARDRTLTPEQFAAGTFTVNNFGVLGSPFSTPIIPIGQAVNLGLGRIAERPLAVDGEVVVRPVLGISCSGDHRILDGADLSRFVNDIVAALADPALLLVELSA